MTKAPKGSQKHIQCYVNQCSDRKVFDHLILSASPSLLAETDGRIEWVSPLAKNDYAEYHDGAFLQKLDLGDHVDALKGFWPSGGPHWDALAKVKTRSGDGAIIVEAKSHLSEMGADDASGATAESSVEMIAGALTETLKYLGASGDISAWRDHHYQVCNRLAHLYFLHEKRHVPTWLVWLFITNDPDWSDKDPASAAQWREHRDNVYHEIGLPFDHPLKDRIVTVYAPPYHGA